MENYSIKNALIDLGFVDGCCSNAEFLPKGWGMFEAMMDSLDRLQEFALEGHVDDAPMDFGAYGRILHDLGYLRGLLWMKPIPDALSEAMDRLTAFFTENGEYPCVLLGYRRPESAEELASDQDRDLARLVVTRSLDAAEIALAIDKPEKVVDRINNAMEGNRPLPFHQWSELEKPEETKPDDEPSVGEASAHAWTPERRAAAVGRAKGRKKPPFDDDLDAVRVDFEAGMSPLNIGRKWGCSDSHIRNFMIKHGIDPRRSSPGVRNGGRPPLTEEQVSTIISEKAKGTPSKEIGEMIDRSQHAVDVKFSGLKKEGLVPESDLTPEVSEERKRVADESRAESMRAFHARKRDGHGIEDIVEDLTESEPEDDETTEDAPAPITVPSAPHRLTVAHPGYAGKREDGQLNDDDWPHIKARLERGDTRRAIASDYDAELEDLEFFISSNQRREAKQPPGEARAPL